MTAANDIKRTILKYYTNAGVAFDSIKSITREQLRTTKNIKHLFQKASKNFIDAQELVKVHRGKLFSYRNNLNFGFI